MTKPTQWSCLGCGTTLSGRGGRRYCGPDCRPRCSVDGCEKPRHGLTYCPAHHTRWKRYGDPLAPKVRGRNDGPCSVDGCDEPMRKTRLCAHHYSMLRTYGEIREWTRKWSPPDQVCAACGAPTPGRKKWCSPACHRLFQRHGNQIPPNPNCVQCGIEIDLLTEGKNGRRKKSDTKLCRKCKAHNKPWASVVQLALRDGPFCQLCGCDVDIRAMHPDPMRASVDHIVPRSWGGSDKPENLQVSHLLCNQIKSDRYEVSMMP